MRDDPERLPGTNILCFLRAISVARYLSRVCIIVVYYLPLATFNLHHFLPRHTMPEQRRPDPPATNNAAEFPAVEISTYDGRKLCPRPLNSRASFVIGIVEGSSHRGRK